MEEPIAMLNKHIEELTQIRDFMACFEKVDGDLPSEVFGKDIAEVETVRMSGSDKIYFVKDGVAQWVKNPETLEGLGFKFGDEREITSAEFAEIEKGDPIDLTKTEEEKEEATQATFSEPILDYRESLDEETKV